VSSELLARGLGARGHTVRVIAVADQASTTARDGYELRTVPPPNVYWDNRKPRSVAAKLAWHALENGNPRAFSMMQREIKDFRPDIMTTVSIENVNVASWLAAHRERVPVAHVLHSYFLLCWRGSLFRDERNCARRCASCLVFSTGKKILSQFVDGVTAESQAALERHLNAGFFKNSMTQVIPGPIESLPKRVVAPSTNAAPLRIGFIGAHTPNKGIETLARAAQLLPSDANVQFLVAGAGESAYTANLRNMFPERITRFVGWVQPQSYFEQIDVNVVPSLWDEPFGRVSVEAQSYGVPVLVARSGGLPANILEGETGFSFDPGDADALSNHIKTLLADRKLLQRMGARAREQAARYSLAYIAEEFSRFLTQTKNRAVAARHRRDW
jgi:glycosyltransferase involved in cell wall biosynthesis